MASAQTNRPNRRLPHETHLCFCPPSPAKEEFFETLRGWGVGRTGQADLPLVVGEMDLIWVHVDEEASADLGLVALGWQFLKPVHNGQEVWTLGATQHLSGNDDDKSTVARQPQQGRVVIRHGQREDVGSVFLKGTKALAAPPPVPALLPPFLGVVLCSKDFFRWNFKVTNEFVEPMLAEDAAAEQFVDAVACLPEVNAGAESPSCYETVGTTFGPVFTQEHKQRILRGLKRRWTVAPLGGSRVRQ